MNSVQNPNWHQARFDLDFAQSTALALHDARMAARNLEHTQRKRLVHIQEYLSKHLVDGADCETLMSFLVDLAADVHPEVDIEGSIYFLTHLTTFFPERGHPDNDPLREAVFWLLLFRAENSSDPMTIGVGQANHGTQNEDSKLVIWLETQIRMAGIKNKGAHYGVSAIAKAARIVLKSDRWAQAMGKGA